MQEEWPKIDPKIIQEEAAEKGKHKKYIVDTMLELYQAMMHQRVPQEPPTKKSD